MFWQDKHFSSRTNMADEIELEGWIECMCRMRGRKEGERARLVGWWDYVEGRVKEREYCSARWAVRWDKAFRDYNRLVTGQSGLGWGGLFTSHSSIGVVTHRTSVPHYPSSDQHVLKQVAEERRRRQRRLIEGTLIDVRCERNLMFGGTSTKDGGVG